MKRITYPKPLMTFSEMISIGIPEAVLLRAIHRKDRPYADKAGTGRTSKWLFNTEEFEYYRSQGAFK